MKLLKFTVCLTAAVALALAVKVSAGETSGANPFLGNLSTATAAELPAKAAELVAKAEVKKLKQTTVDVVKAAVGLNPAAAPAIVGSIAQASPDMAGTAAASAVVLVPNQAVAIARAAAAAAPTKAGAIVEAICRVLPKSYQAVANAVAEVVPGSGKEILTGIAIAIPELKNVINQTLASYDGKIPSVSAVLTQVAQTGSLAGTTAFVPGAPVLTPVTASVVLPRGAAPGAPGVPGSPTLPLDPVSPNGSTTPTRGHTYSAP